MHPMSHHSHERQNESEKPSHAHDSAGYVMTAKVPVVAPEQTIGDVYEFLRKRAAEYDTINYVYVVDTARVLRGVLSVREIFSMDRSCVVGHVCVKDPLYCVHPSSHQERAAYLALRHGIKAIPVVDSHGTFLGEVAADSILRILHKEMHEDTLRRAGITHPAAVHSNVFKLSLLSSFRHRIPWLLLGLFGGVLAAKVIGFFETILSKNLVLAAFIPLIVYMSDAVGTQMEAYIIRDLAVERDIPFLRYLIRHGIVVFAIGIVLGTLLFGMYGVTTGDWFMALVLSLSLFAAVLSSVCTGLLVPYIFSRFALDPADASGPVATIIQDILSIVIYFSVASILL
jgi:magnesium transporter